jgi:uncharacterized protein
MKNIITVSIIFVIFMSLGYYSYSMLLTSSRFSPPEQKTNSVTIPLLAVDSNNNGMVIPLTVEVIPGSGRILVNIDNPSFISDTQDSMRLAAKEATQMTGTSLNDYDITFSLTTNVTVIGGPSAGAAMTLAAMALLLNKQLNTGVAITGTIEEGGYIGQVGGIEEKATAAKQAGIKLLLVPEGESVYREPVEKCNTGTGQGWTRKECSVTYQTVNVSEDMGINIKEVNSISEAMNYLIG